MPGPHPSASQPRADRETTRRRWLAAHTALLMLGAQLALFPNLTTNDPVWREVLRDARFRRALSLAINRYEINQVVYFGARGLQHITVLYRFDLVDEPGRNANAFAGSEGAFVRLPGLRGPEDELTLQHVHSLVLLVVVLQAQHFAGVHMKNLSDVAIGSGPHQLVAPRLLHTVRHFSH